MAEALRTLRTWLLCAAYLVFIFALAFHNGWGAIETGVAMSPGLGFWVGGKGWQSSPEVITAAAEFRRAGQGGAP